MKFRCCLSLAVALVLKTGSVVAADNPDTTGVWYHIRHQQTELANAELKRLQNRYPNWQPKEALRQAMLALNSPHIAEKTERASTKPEPLEMTAPSSANIKASLLGELAAMNEGQWQRLPGDLLTRAEQIAEADGNDDALLLVGWINMSRQQFERASNLFLQVSDERSKQRQDALAAAVDARVFEAISNDNYERLQLLFRNQPTQVRPLVDGAGWQAYEDGEMVRARALFTIINERFGQVLALDAMGHQDNAIQLACGTLGSDDIEDWCNNALAAQLASLYQQEDYPAAIHVASQLKNRNAMTPELSVLIGWASANAGDFPRAQQVFTELLANTPEDESLQQALLHAYQYDVSALAPLSGRYPFVARFIREQRGLLAWNRKQFELADRSGITRVKQPGVSRWQIFTGLSSRHRSGLRGLGHLDEQAGYTGVSTMLHGTRVELVLRHERLFSGATDNEAWLGGGQVNAPFTGDTSQTGEGAEANIYQQQKDWNWYGNIGYLLLDQPVSPRLTGALGGTYFQADWQLSLTAYRQRRKDSMLSQTGTQWRGENPFDTAWGSVLQTGVKGLGVLNVNDDWALSTSVNLASLDGERVQDNNTYGVRFDLSREMSSQFKGVPLDYLRIAPYISWQHYDHDLSNFTFGQGGYFSPQRYFSAGLSAELLTAEARQWQIRSRISTGWSSVYEQGGRRFPLSNKLLVEAEVSDQAGLGVDLYVEGQYLLSERWAVAGYLSHANALAYHATFGGIELRWFAGKRQSLTSDTLISARPDLDVFLF